MKLCVYIAFILSLFYCQYNLAGKTTSVKGGEKNKAVLASVLSGKENGQSRAVELNKNPNLIGLLVDVSQKTSDDDKMSSQSDLLEGKENTPKKEARSPEDHSPVLPYISNQLKLNWFLRTPERAGRRINNFGKVTPRSEKRKKRMNNRPYSFGERDNGTGNAKK